MRNFRGRYLAEEAQSALTSLRISAKAILTACLKIRREVFLCPQFVFGRQVSRATRKEDWPDSPTVNEIEGMEKTAMRNRIVRKLAFGLFALCAIVGSMVLSGCDFGNNTPPVSLTFRESLLKGYVLQLHNRSSNRVVAHVYVKNERLNQARNVSVSIAPNAMEELGVLEMDWTFMPSENGSVSVDGFSQKLHFKIKDGGYDVW